MLGSFRLTLIFVLACGSSGNPSGSTAQNGTQIEGQPEVEAEVEAAAEVEAEPDPNDIRTGHIPRIITAYEIGENYLRYALDNDERILQVAQCEDEAIQTGHSIRGEEGGLIFESVVWTPSDESMPGPSQDAPGQLRYQLTVAADGQQEVREGVLSFEYNVESRSFLVICPLN